MLFLPRVFCASGCAVEGSWLASYFIDDFVNEAGFNVEVLGTKGS